MDENNQELIFKLGFFEQQIRQLQQQINSIDEGIVEIESLGIGLDGLKNSNGKEIFAPVGRGIFVKSKIISDDLLVDIGNRNLVKKSVPEAQEMIKKQIEKLHEIKKELEKNLEDVGREAEKMIKESEKSE